MRNNCKSARICPVILIASLSLCIISFKAHGNDEGDCIFPIDSTFGDQLLTREEKIEILNKRYYAALVRFEECMLAKSGGGQGAGAGGASGAQGSASGAQGSASGGQTYGAQFESVAATGIQGTELPEPTDSSYDSAEPSGTWEDPDDEEVVLSNGQSPEELEATDNDAILLEQLRQAATAEEDPEKKEKLWQEYRKRSGAGSKQSEGS